MQLGAGVTVVHGRLPHPSPTCRPYAERSAQTVPRNGDYLPRDYHRSITNSSVHDLS